MLSMTVDHVDIFLPAGIPLSLHVVKARVISVPGGSITCNVFVEKVFYYTCNFTLFVDTLIRLKDVALCLRTLVT